MPRLVLLNGAPGVGKSTLARRWVADRTTAVVVEIDALRTSIDGWQADDSTKLEARRLALEVADAHLRADVDVIVPQYLGRIDFIEELDRTATRAGATFVELLLTADEDEVVARFEHRRAGLATDEHPEHEVDDVREVVSEAFDRLRLVTAARPSTRLITAGAEVDDAVAELAALLDR